MEKLRELWDKTWVKIIVLGLFAALLLGGMVANNSMTSSKSKSSASASASSEPVPTLEGLNESAQTGINGGTDKLLANMQDSLKEEYGTPPEGFVWDQQGHPISLGIEGLSSEDAAYEYLRALSTLDMGIAQKLSRDSKVLSTYSEYHDSKSKSAIVDYSDAYRRDVYKQAMLSLEIRGVENSTVFADNKRAYTVKASMVDLTDKDFWLKDKDALFEQLWSMDQVQDDSGKAEQYVDDYVLNYYKSDTAKRRDVTFTITVERYPDLNSGWLVSVDEDLDSLLQNKDVVSAPDYIMNQYREYRKNRQLAEREASTKK